MAAVPPAGLFVTLEGPEGSGKTTQLALLADALRARGQGFTVAREPGGTPVAERIRRVLLEPDDGPLPLTEALLFCAARAELIERVVRPALAKGEVVLCDRYADSTLAYQGYGRGLPLDWLREVVRGATGGLTPDLTLLFDLPPETGLARRRSAGDEWNRLDAADLAFHRRVRAGFLALAAVEPARWVVVPAEGQADEVTRVATAALLRRLDDRNAGGIARGERRP